MATQSLPRFDDLRRRFGGGAESVARISLAAALDAGDDPAHVLSYLAELGFAVTSLDELAAALDALDDEEKLTAFPCREGVAVSHASDGFWLLFVQ